MRMALKISSFSASLVMFVVGADFPAQAQFMTSYPAIIVVPPPAQNLALLHLASNGSFAVFEGSAKRLTLLNPVPTKG